jgi:hypothetical protein
MSQVRPMTYASRRERFEKDRGTTRLTNRQERRIRKAGKKAEFRRPKERAARVRQRVIPGRRKGQALRQRHAYATQLAEERQTNLRTIIGRAVFTKKQHRG